MVKTWTYILNPKEQIGRVSIFKKSDNEKNSDMRSPRIQLLSLPVTGKAVGINTASVEDL